MRSRNTKNLLLWEISQPVKFFSKLEIHKWIFNIFPSILRVVEISTIDVKIIFVAFGLWTIFCTLIWKFSWKIRFWEFSGKKSKCENNVILVLFLIFSHFLKQMNEPSKKGGFLCFQKLTHISVLKIGWENYENSEIRFENFKQFSVQN